MNTLAVHWYVGSEKLSKRFFGVFEHIPRFVDRFYWTCANLLV